MDGLVGKLPLGTGTPAGGSGVVVLGRGVVVLGSGVEKPPGGGFKLGRVLAPAGGSALSGERVGGEGTVGMAGGTVPLGSEGMIVGTVVVGIAVGAGLMGTMGIPGWTG